MIMTLVCLMAVGAKAQIFSYDRPSRMPTRDLYDPQMMNMVIQSAAASAKYRREKFDNYSQMAVEAYHGKRWGQAITYVNMALETRYESGTLYYIRGFAYEQLGNYKAAKKDYKLGIKHESEEAALALEALEEKQTNGNTQQ